MHALTGDFYEYDESAQKLVGRSTGKTYIVGDIVRAVLRECVPVTGSLVFSLVKGGSFEAPKKRSVRPKQKRTFYRRRRKKK
jgi:ribonuclease R